MCLQDVPRCGELVARDVEDRHRQLPRGEEDHDADHRRSEAEQCLLTGASAVGGEQFGDVDALHGEMVEPTVGRRACARPRGRAPGSSDSSTGSDSCSRLTSGGPAGGCAARGRARGTRARPPSPALVVVRARSVSIAAMRPGRAAITTTRSDRITASVIEWVTKTTVVPVRSHNSSSRYRMSARVISSSAANGSSISRIGAPSAKPRTSDTRCCMPPDSSCGYDLRKRPRPDRVDELVDLVVAERRVSALAVRARASTGT